MFLVSFQPALLVNSRPASTVEDDGSGPPLAALWLVSSLLADPDAVLLTPGTLGERACEVGFAKVMVQELIPEITKVLTATKPR